MTPEELLFSQLERAGIQHPNLPELANGLVAALRAAGYVVVPSVQGAEEVLEAYFDSMRRGEGYIVDGVTGREAAAALKAAGFVVEVLETKEKQ